MKNFMKGIGRWWERWCSGEVEMKADEDENHGHYNTKINFKRARI